MEDDLRKYIPFIEKEFLTEIQENGIFKSIPKGNVILHDGTYVQAVPIVLSGRIKVFNTSEEKDLLLYYIRPGESCVMSFSACMTQSPSRVAAITEEDTDVLLIPSEKLYGWLKRFPSLNTFLFEIYNKRYLELLETVDQLVSWNMEARLMKYLNDKVEYKSINVLHATHQEIAQDLGTAREVISRVLKKLQNEGKIRLSRNSIEVL